MTTHPLASRLRELDTAEAFLEHFGIDYSRGVIDVNRLLILRRFHDALAEHDLDGVEEQEALSLVRTLLQRAYDALAQPKDMPGAKAAAPARTETLGKVLSANVRAARSGPRLFAQTHVR